jgi:hypothetical protein
MTVPQAKPGNAAAAMVQIRSAAESINKALPSIPMGTDFYKDVSEVAVKLNKLLLNTPNDPGVQAGHHLQAARDLSQSAPAQALGRMFPQQAGAQPGQAQPTV